MSISKGNELLQELYSRLSGLWYKTGQYKNERFNHEQVKDLIKKIKKDYDNEQS